MSRIYTINPLRYFFLFVALLLTQVVSAQPSTLQEKNIIFDQIQKKLGLSQGTINSMIQDREGYLWIGTWSGLIRYDGYSTTVFHSSRGPGKIKSNKILKLYEDKKGKLWIGTHMGGLFQYNRNDDTFIHYSHDPANPQSLSNNNVTSIQEDDQGNLWIGTEKGLNVFRGDKNVFDKFFASQEDTSSLSANFVTDLLFSSDNNLWIATPFGVNRLIRPSSGRYSFEKYFHAQGTRDSELLNYIFQLSELTLEGKSSLWLSTMKGLVKLENKKLEAFQVPGKPSPYSIMRSVLAVNGEHPFVLAGSEMGLHLFDVNSRSFTKFFSNHEETGNLSQSTITSLYFDRGGVLWVGTKRGLNKFDSHAKNFESYKTAKFDSAKNIITGLQGSASGGYWISTVGGGLYKFHNGSFTHIRIKNSAKNEFTNFVQTIFRDSRGNIWLGTAGAGVYRFQEKQYGANNSVVTSFDHFHTRSTPALNHDFIMALEEDAQGNMWVGSWSGGLSKITPAGEVVQYNEPELKQGPLVALHADLSGVLWVGTRGNGLYRVRTREGKTDIHIYKQEKDSIGSLSNNFINAIFEDHGGTLWIGTEDGLNSFDRRLEKFSTVEIKNSLDNSVIVSVLEDDKGKLWLAHWNGLTVIDPLDKDYIKNYDIHDRIQGGFFYSNVCYKDSNGKLLFAGSDGFNIIDPQALAGNNYRAPLVIQDFEILNKPVPGENFDDGIPLDRTFSHGGKVELKHFENTISFEFAALDFAAPDKIQYSYKLEGLDKEWTYSDASRRYVNYTNLNYGTYTFKVRATNNEGVWNEQASEIRIVIQPPWWKTRWALLLYAVVAMFVLYGFRKLILIRANFIHDIKLERVQRENMEKLNRAKLQFFTNISHEFRTPLTLILGPVQNLIESGSGSKFVRERLHNINNNAQRLLRLVNQLLDFRKAESGNLKLEVSEGNLVKFVKEIKLSFDALAEQMKIDFNFYPSSNVIKAWFDRDQFEKIMFNLLSNAFKHTPENGSIAIRMIEGREDITIAIEDSGKGIKPEHFETIFQTFFSYDEDRHHSGTGIGLALTKSLVDAHHGSINVERIENCLTRFTVKLLSGNKHFDQSELMQSSRDTEHITMYPILTTDTFSEDDKGDNTDQLLHIEDQPKLLVVEDNAEVRAYIKSIFLGRFVILEAEDGKEGFALASEEIPDVIISDVMMPVMDGISMTKQLKSDGKTSHIPVILLTARTSLIFKVEGLETGADDYVNKPFNPRILQLKVRNLIHIRELMRKAFRDNDGLSIEPKRVTFTSADEGFVQKILESIENNMNNADYSVEELGLDVAMSRMQLYRKLKALTGQSANEFIRTIRLKRAAQLLEQNQMTIAEITYEVGFNDLQYFRECFKKLFGMTPSEYTQKKVKDPIAE